METWDVSDEIFATEGELFKQIDCLFSKRTEMYWILSREELPEQYGREELN